MQLSRSPKTNNAVDYYLLPNGSVDVFLHRNETTELDDEENVVYIAEEVYFQVDQSVTKEYIESNFDLMWQDSETKVEVLTVVDRLVALEEAMMALI